MKKKYIGRDDPLTLRKNKIYDVISIENGWYRIVDETGEDYLFPPKFFVDESEMGDVDSSTSDYVEKILLRAMNPELNVQKKGNSYTR